MSFIWVGRLKALIFLVAIVISGLTLFGCTSLSPTEEPVVDTECSQNEPHPIGESIASDFKVPYEQVMGWYCAGESFEDILLALQTSEMVDLPADELLVRKEQVGWEAVWEDLGLVPKQKP